MLDFLPEQAYNQFHHEQAFNPKASADCGGISRGKLDQRYVARIVGVSNNTVAEASWPISATLVRFIRIRFSAILNASASSATKSGVLFMRRKVTYRQSCAACLATATFIPGLRSMLTQS